MILFFFSERAFDRHFQIDEVVGGGVGPSTPRGGDRTDSCNPPPTPQSLHAPSTPSRNPWVGACPPPPGGGVDLSRWPRGQGNVPGAGPYPSTKATTTTLTNLTNVLSNLSSAGSGCGGYVEPLSLPSVTGAGSRQGYHSQQNCKQNSSKLCQK